MKSRVPAGRPPPQRKMPQRSAKAAGVAAVAGSRPSATKTSGARVTRSSTALAAPVYESSDGNYEGTDISSAFRGVKRAPSTPPPHRVVKRKRYRSGYYDEASESDADDNAYLSPTTDDEDELAAPVTTPRKKTKLPKTPPSKAKSGLSTPKSQRTPAGKSPELCGDQDICLPEASETIPPWSQLPYFVLVQIFEFAAPAPLDLGSVRWLLAASRLCRAFAEPALTALYKSPPLLSLSMAHNFENFLSGLSDNASFSYKQKIKRLVIDVEMLATKTYRGRHLDLGALVQAMPRLREVDIWHPKDCAPYRQLDDNLKWHYPPALFNSLGALIPSDNPIAGPVGAGPQSVRLLSWQWSSRMMGGHLRLEDLRHLHMAPCFNGLRRVTFVNYQLPSLRATNPDDPAAIQEDRDFVTSLADAINVLPQLSHLAIESSTAVNAHLLSLLPATIRHLELINCWDVKAEDLADYLLSHGRQLRHLTLHHNQSLSLAFLPVLGAACSNLRSLQMDPSCFRHHEFYRDSDPLYDALLTADQVPTWPSSLEYLELKNLRKWDADAAECFFQSLVDSALELPNLRHLAIKAMLDIPFRKRSEFRDTWVAKSRQVFLRRWEDPLPMHSLRPLLSDQQPAGPVTPSKRRNRGADPSSIRRSYRIAISEMVSSSRASSIGRDLRTAGGRPSYAEPDTDEDLESEEDVDEENGSGGDENTAAIPFSPNATDHPFVQGMCNVVDIRFDNQKPTENQYNMEDFLDSESDDPSDDDWTGDRDTADDDYAW